jgi:hypothetical protein
MPAPRIEPDLKAFLDEVLVPMLVHDALQELSSENHLAPESSTVAESPRTDFLRIAKSSRSQEGE